MKIKRSVLNCALICTLLLTLCACGSTAPAAVPPSETVPAVNTPAPAPRPEDTPEEIRSIEELYEKTDTEHIFSLSNIGTDGYYVENASMKDGYVLLCMRDYSEQGYVNEAGIQHLLGSGRLVLFPLLRPEGAVSLDLEHLSSTYTLMSDGSVLGANWNGSYTMYNSKLEVIYSGSDCGSFLGASEQGDIWYLTEDSSFVLYRDGQKTQTIGAEGMLHGDYLDTRDGKAYFQMFNTYYGWTYSVIDMQTWAYDEIRLMDEACDIHNGKISYHSEDRWYIADIDNPLTVTAFSKPHSDETDWSMDDSYLIGLTYNYDEVRDSFRQDCRIYDMRNGGLCDEKGSEQLTEHELSMLDYAQGVILFETHDENMATKGLYLWDLSGLSAPEPAAVYEKLDYHVDEDRVNELIREIHDQYGVTVYYDAEHLSEYSSGYDLIECTDAELLGYTLLRLKECMAEYPAGFFEEIKGDSIENVVYCLCGAHDRVDMDTIEDAAATVTTIGDTLRMSIDVHYWQGLRRIFLHENTHMMETRLEEEMPKVSSRNYVEYWYTELNLPDCPPVQNYIWEQTDETMKGVYDVDPDNACYIDWYSKCTINEDHARIMENGIYSASAHYFTAPYIDRKSRFLNAMIREAFPCVQDSQYVFWEQRTGAVDLRQEFGDFAGQ